MATVIKRTQITTVNSKTMMDFGNLFGSPNCATTKSNEERDRSCTQLPDWATQFDFSSSQIPHPLGWHMRVMLCRHTRLHEITITLTTVGLAQAHPNYRHVNLVSTCIMSAIITKLQFWGFWLLATSGVKCQSQSTINSFVWTVWVSFCNCILKATPDCYVSV